MSELTDVEKSTDELWLGVKCQSNSELAGSPRNAFRRSIVKNRRGRALFQCGPVKGYLIVANYECFNDKSETLGDKLQSQEGNSPDHQLRPLNNS